MTTAAYDKGWLAASIGIAYRSADEAACAAAAMAVERYPNHDGYREIRANIAKARSFLQVAKDQLEAEVTRAPEVSEAMAEHYADHPSTLRAGDVAAQQRRHVNGEAPHGDEIAAAARRHNNWPVSR